MARIETARLHDLPGAYRVCLLTGDAGRDASARYRDLDLLGHLYVGPYLVAGTGTQLVVVDAGGVSGYLVSADDTLAFETWAEAAWWPALRARHPLLADGSPDADLVARIHAPERTPVAIARVFPAHAHVDLLERVRGLGLGRALMDRLAADLRARSVAGVHLGVDPSNTDAVAFYAHLGYRELQVTTDTIWMGLRLA